VAYLVKIQEQRGIPRKDPGAAWHPAVGLQVLGTVMSVLAEEQSSLRKDLSYAVVALPSFASADLSRLGLTPSGTCPPPHGCDLGWASHLPLLPCSSFGPHPFLRPAAWVGEGAVSVACLLCPCPPQMTALLCPCPPQMAALISAIIAAEAEDRKQQLQQFEAGSEKKVSAVALSLEQLNNGVRVPPSPSQWKCAKCAYTQNLWLNLTDGTMLCGRANWDGTGATAMRWRTSWRPSTRWQ